MASNNHRKETSARLKVALLSTGHLVNDIHTAFLDTFLPELVKKLSLNYTQAGILTSLSGVIHMFFQPVMGYIADRHTKPWAIILGPIAAAIGASSIPLSPNYSFALIMVAVWTIGAAAFHPQGQGSIGYVSPPSELAFSISLFGIAGMTGSTMSSLYAITLYRFLPPLSVPFVALIPVSLLAWSYLHYMPVIREIPKGTENNRGMMTSLVAVFKKIWPIWAVTITRDCSKRGLRFLIPLMVVARGGSLIQVGTILFSMSLLTAILPIIVARLAMKYGNPLMAKVSLPMGSIIMLTGWAMSGSVSILLFIIGGSIMTSCTPATAAMAQEQAPEERSTASSLMMGFSFGLGGVAMAPLGLFTDFTSIETALGVISFLPLLSVPVMFYLWPKKGIE